MIFYSSIDNHNPAIVFRRIDRYRQEKDEGFGEIAESSSSRVHASRGTILAGTIGISPKKKIQTYVKIDVDKGKEKERK